MWITVDAQTNQKDDVKRETVYCLDDDNETEVQKEDIIQGEKALTCCSFLALKSDRPALFSQSLSLFVFEGFRYGSDIVPFSKVDQDQMKYKHDGKCFAVLGFTRKNLVVYPVFNQGFD